MEKIHRILIVDDEKNNLDVLVGLLSQEYKTVFAKNGQQALIRAQGDTPPDLIILDIMMPEMDGFEVCRRLKANKSTCGIPIIFITGKGDEADESKGLELGAVDYISKPINPAILTSRVRTHLAIIDQNRTLEIRVAERTAQLAETQEALRKAMGNLLTLKVAPGVFWLQIPEVDLRILCGCPGEVVKLLMNKGFNSPAIKDGVNFETGPNVILLSDVMVQNGGFANLAEFPVLQMLYRQGLILPGHPNNTGVKPMLIGSEDQVKAQMDYIHRGNYGLLSKEEIMTAGVDSETAKTMMRIKLKFAFGNIRDPSQFLDTLILSNQLQELRHGVTVRRIDFNKFQFSYRGQSADIDLNLPQGAIYKSPYPLGHHRIQKHYFAVVHTGEGDGWDVDRPSMSSVLMFQGRIYLIDAAPSVLYSLNALGIDISEVEGIFHTHAHDDHFAGLTGLIRTDRKLKYFSTPLVRASVAKKFSALMSIEEHKFAEFFDIYDLKFNVWNKLGGLEVMPIYTPHPIENNMFFFRSLDGHGYRSYAHWADLSAFSVLDRMVGEGPMDVLATFVAKVKSDYLLEADLKKLDIGGGMIHGVASDFKTDPSKRLILAHLARELTAEEMEIGSETSFGAMDILISGEQDYRRQRLFQYLRGLFPIVSEDELRMLLNGSIVEHNAGSILRKENEETGTIDIVVSGTVLFLDVASGVRNHLGFGSFMGLGLVKMDDDFADGTYRAVSHGSVLRISLPLFKSFLHDNNLLADFVHNLRKISFLRRTWIFGEQTSFAFLAEVTKSMEFVSFNEGEKIDLDKRGELFLVEKGRVSIQTSEGHLFHEVVQGEFFGEHRLLNRNDIRWNFHAKTDCNLYCFPREGLLSAPIVHWKLLEVYEKRIRLSPLALQLQ